MIRKLGISKSFESNIFINCPFDEKYKKLLRPILFTCIYLRLNPLISELKDSGSLRIEQIITYIKSSRFSIHDLSRMASTKIGELARFNLPFELGLDFGIREQKKDYLSKKRFLILDVEPYRYKAALSDISGYDIQFYGKRNQVLNVIENIKHWLETNSSEPLESASAIHMEFNEFNSDLQLKLKEFNFTSRDFKNMTNSEYIKYCKKWMVERKKK